MNSNRRCSAVLILNKITKYTYSIHVKDVKLPPIAMPQNYANVYNTNIEIDRTDFSICIYIMLGRP